MNFRTILGAARLPAVLLPALLALPGHSDSVKPLQFGPYVLNKLSMVGSPAGYDYVLTNGGYQFQLGWVEPIANDPSSVFHHTYFETSGDFNISPYQFDLGTTFNLKPIRYLEIGLTYHRLIFNNSLVAFSRRGDDLDDELSVPPRSEWRPSAIYEKLGHEPAGADVFTYQANFTIDAGRLQFFLLGSRTLWDIDAKGRDFVFEFSSDLLIWTHDRVNSAVVQLSLDLRPYSLYRTLSYTGFSVRNQYWSTEHTFLRKNLVSFGITGFRIGRNRGSQRRGLDLSVGYYTLHDQLPGNDPAKALVVLADWRWNIQFLDL